MFRTLRSTYNKVIKERCAHLSDYPFQEYKISKFDTSTQKRAIAKNGYVEVYRNFPTDRTEKICGVK